MESDAKYTVVGFIVILCTISVVAAILWLSQGGANQQTDLYAIYFKEATLDGLQIDSNVTMRGIKVGTVASITIVPHNIEQVRVIVKLEHKTPVKVDTRAIIVRNLLTGLAVVDLIGSSRESPLLAAQSSEETLPIIREGRSRLEAIASNMPDLLRDVGSAVSRINTFLSPENEAAFQSILANLNQVSGALAKNEQTIEQVLLSSKTFLEGATKASDSVNRFSSEASHGMSMINVQLESGLKELRELIRGLGSASGELSRTVSQSAQLINQDMTQLTRSVDEAARAISTTAERYEDPRAVVFGPSERALGPGEERR
jgi:phospholipid/cholesterol/gamma-HCH transport system substrate-binding protein